MSLAITNRELRGEVVTAGGSRVPISEGRVLWLRRPRANQTINSNLYDGDALDLINNDCRMGLTGTLATAFKGKWISSPEATAKGSDKIFQLGAARSCGFRVPDTLVTQQRQEVIDFYESHRGKIVVKTLAGAQGPFLLTRFLEEPQEMDEGAFAVCPALYQEYIPGSRHIRLNCFGERSHAALIESDQLDWRPNLNIPIRSWAVPDELHSRVRRVLDSLELDMGIIDLKLSPEGEFVWLEVNPQGQFLFLDALTDLNLASHFSEYLIQIAKGI